MENQMTTGIAQSNHACLACRQSKRRCDRIVSGCTLCLERRIICNYPHRRKERERRSTQANLHVSVAVGAAATSHARKRPVHPALSAPNASEFLAIRFLDPAVFHRMGLEIPNVDVAISKAVTDWVGTVSDIQATSNTHFVTVHTWMPIISKRTFTQHLLHLLAHKKAELFLLILSMKLCCSTVTAPRTVLYRVVKQFYFEIESAGVLSIRVLQAGIFIALYELGHAIYPAVTLTVGNCARYATTLGVDKTANAVGSMQLSWVQEEEYRRAWWAITILDRFINLCNPGRHFATAVSDLQTYLPVDDEDWDAGISKAEDASTIGSSLDCHLGRFARFAQAAHLLTQALRCESEDVDMSTQLRRTIFSLVNLSDIEGRLREVGFCTQLALCYSAMLLLESPCASGSQGAIMHAGEVLSPETTSALRAAVDMISYLLDSTTQTCDRVSPFLAHFIYMAASVYQDISYGENSHQMMHDLDTLKQALQLLNNRWLVSGTYLSLLERREILLVTESAAL